MATPVFRMMSNDSSELYVNGRGKVIPPEVMKAHMAAMEALAKRLACIGVASASAVPSPAKEMMEQLARGLMPEEPAAVVSNPVGIWTVAEPSEQDVTDAKARDDRRWKALRSVL